MMIPDLEPHCGSWIIVQRSTGKPVLETFERQIAAAINQGAYEVMTTGRSGLHVSTALHAHPSAS